MKKLKQARQFLILLLITSLLFSCAENDTLIDSNDIEQNVNFVDLFKVEKIAQNIKHQVNNKNLKSKGITSVVKSIEKINIIPDENGYTTYYIVNYKEGGFLLLSADNRVKPVLAYSENNFFPFDDRDYPSGLVQWLFNTKEKIKNIRNSNKLQSKEVKYAWEIEKIQNTINEFLYENRIDPIGNDCLDNLEIVGPLLNTTWYQGCGFNTYMPVLNCSDYPCYSNNRAYAGCVPIAMAQIMKFHNYPTNYNWSNMPNDYGTTTTASFIKDIHTGIDNLPNSLLVGEPLSYECNSTGVKNHYDMSDVLKNSFNYSSAKRADYNYSTVVNELRNNRPVILSGSYVKQDWILFKIYSGHMWVCDGFREHKICMFDDYGNNIGAVTYLFLHMNWGWGGLYDGYFGFDDFDPGTSTYNDKNKMIYNIIP